MARSEHPEDLDSELYCKASIDRRLKGDVHRPWPRAKASKKEPFRRPKGEVRATWTSQEHLREVRLPLQQLLGQVSSISSSGHRELRTPIHHAAENACSLLLPHILIISPIYYYNVRIINAYIQYMDIYI